MNSFLDLLIRSRVIDRLHKSNATQKFLDRWQKISSDKLFTDLKIVHTFYKSKDNHIKLYYPRYASPKLRTFSARMMKEDWFFSYPVLGMDFSERLSLLSNIRKFHPRCLSTLKKKERLLQTIEIVSLDNTSHYHDGKQLFSMFNITSEDMSAAIALGKMQMNLLKGKFSSTPHWLKYFQVHYNPAKLTSDYPLLTPVSPLFLATMEGIKSELYNLMQKDYVNRLDLKALIDCASSELTEKLSYYCSKPIVAELTVASRAGALQGSEGSDNFNRFITHLKSEPLSRAFINRYPVLVNICSSYLRNFRCAFIELVQRVIYDYERIKAKFSPGNDLGRLSNIDFGYGDSHCRGRVVSILIFESGLKLVYKPRSVLGEVFYYECLQTLSSLGDFPNFVTPKILPKNGYGYCSFIEHLPCDNNDEVDLFYYRHGLQLALLYVLGATDLHSENLIAHRDSPVVIDLETILQPIPTVNTHAEAIQIAISYLRHSVHSIGLLPQEIHVGANAGSVDVSGLSQVEGQLSPIPLPTWKDWGLDSMRIEREFTRFSEGKNLPILNGEKVGVSGYLSRLYEGFTAASRVIMDYRDNFKTLINQSNIKSTRVVLRPTYLYEFVLQESLHPRLLVDAMKREQYLSLLWSKDQKEDLSCVLRSEHKALWANDIPIFFSNPKRYDLINEDNESLSNFFSVSGVEAAELRLNKLSDECIQEQLWFFDLAFGWDRQWQTPQHFGNGSLLDKEILLDEAIRIGEIISSQAFMSEGQAAWLIVSEGGNGSYVPDVGGSDIYYGIPGILLFLVKLWEFTGEKKYKDIVLAGLKSLKVLMDEDSTNVLPISFSSGMFGLLYAMHHIQCIVGDPYSECLRRQIIESLKLTERVGIEGDVLSGAAGIALVMLSCLNCNEREELEMLLTAVDAKLRSSFHDLEIKLYEHKKNQSKDTAFGGFGHGRIGELFALERLLENGYSSVNHDFFWEVINEIFASGKGTDFYGVNMTWCRGYSGSQLALLGLREGIVDGVFEAKAAHFLDTFQNAKLLPTDCACHGELGALEPLLHDEFREAVGERVDKVLSSRLVLLSERVAEQGWRCSSSVDSANLFEGLSGIGYQLLRIYDPVRVPSFLSVSSPEGNYQSG